MNPNAYHILSIYMSTPEIPTLMFHLGITVRDAEAHSVEMREQLVAEYYNKCLANMGFDGGGRE